MLVRSIPRLSGGFVIDLTGPASQSFNVVLLTIYHTLLAHHAHASQHLLFTSTIYLASPSFTVLRPHESSANRSIPSPSNLIISHCF